MLSAVWRNLNIIYYRTVTEYLAAGVEQHPDFDIIFNAVKDIVQRLNNDGIPLPEVNSKVSDLLQGRKRRRLDLGEVRSNIEEEEGRNPEVAIPLSHLRTIRWGKAETGTRFLRQLASQGVVGFTAEEVITGFDEIDKIIGFTPNTYQGYATLERALDQRAAKTLHHGFGAGSYHLEKITNQSYWIGVHQRLVLISMGRVLKILQEDALADAQDRVERRLENDTITVTSNGMQSCTIPVGQCDMAIVHRNSWQAAKSQLADSAHAEYIRLGGNMERTEYVRKYLKEMIKRSLLLLALCESYGPIVIFWDGLTPSRLYKIKYTEARAAPVPPEEWSPLNRQLGKLTTMRPDLTVEARQRKIETIFHIGTGEWIEESEIYDYLEDEVAYKEIRNRCISQYIRTRPAGNNRQ
jgi:hypothetical protein